MSVPRFRRTVALTPRATSSCRNSCTPAGAVPFVGQPGVGLRGMRFTWGGSGRLRQRAASSSASLTRSLTPSINAHSKLRRRPLASR